MGRVSATWLSRYRREAELLGSNQGENFGPLKDAVFAAKQSVELDLDMYLDTWECEMLDLIVTLELGTSP